MTRWKYFMVCSDKKRNRFWTVYLYLPTNNSVPAVQLCFQQKHFVFVFSSASDWSQKSDRQKSPGTLFLSFSPCLWTFMNMEKPGIGAHFCINLWARNVNVKLISACGKSGKNMSKSKMRWSIQIQVFLVTVWGCASSELHLWLCLWVLNLYNGSHHANGECAFHCTWIVKNKVVYRNHNYI